MAAGTAMTPEVLAKYIGYHKRDVGMFLGKLDRAYRGDYDIFHQTSKPKWKPDNRIAFGFAKYIVDTMNGYFMGTPVRITHDNADVNDYLELLGQYSGVDDIDAELGKLCDEFGLAHEIYYCDEDSKLCIQQVSPMESFMIYDETILNRPMYFVRYYRDSNNVERGSWSDTTVVQHFVRSGAYRWDGEATEHHFGDVPATEFIENEERIGLIAGALSPINAFNKAISEKANDVDAFADAYLKIIGPKLSKEDLNFIRDNRIINLDTELEASKVAVEFLQKPNGDTTQENLLNRLYKGIFQMCMVADLSDESFAGTASGVALKFKLQAMSNLADTKQRKFEASLNRRYKILFSNPLSTVPADSWIGIDYKFTKNLPANVLEESQIAKNLEGVVTKQTQLSVLSIVDDPKREAEEVENTTAQVPMVNNVLTGGGTNGNVSA
jgi:SPP1 family phage portal protein